MRCKVCQFTIRGDNHEKGPHHLGKMGNGRSLHRARKNGKLGRKTNIGDPRSDVCKGIYPDLYRRYHNGEF